MTGTPEGHRKCSYGEVGNRTCDPWFTRHRFIPYTTAACSDLGFEKCHFTPDKGISIALVDLKNKKFISDWFLKT